MEQLDANQDPFEYLGSQDVLGHDSKAHTVLMDMGADWYQLVLFSSVVLLIITLMVVFMKIMMSRKGKQKEELKELIGLKIKVIFTIELMGILIGIVLSIAHSFI